MGQLAHFVALCSLTVLVHDSAYSMAMCRQNPSSISLKAGCELFLRYTTRTSAIENEDFAVTKARLIERGNQFAETSARARSAIADAGSRFLTNGCMVLVHGHSRVIVDTLIYARKHGAHFRVLVTEGRPGEAAVRVAKELVPAGIETTIILDSAAAYHMDRCTILAVLLLVLRMLLTTVWVPDQNLPRCHGHGCGPVNLLNEPCAI